ncbi:MAG: recombinase family protein [Ktedonobacteraceae bacterium]
MAGKGNAHRDLKVIPMLLHETLYVGVDIGKKSHVAGFISPTLLISELSRLGRSLLEIMSILHTLMEKDVQVYTAKERYELSNTISSKVLAFAFGISAEIERSLISARTKEGLARRKAEGKKLGRPTGSRSRASKLTGKEADIDRLLRSGVSQAAIARLLGVNRHTIECYVKSRR